VAFGQSETYGCYTVRDNSNIQVKIYNTAATPNGPKTDWYQ